ncbi:UNVERIFIED_CONTAM: hypothetical protein FKN15_012500 [Acipenser sinensis]
MASPCSLCCNALVFSSLAVGRGLSVLHCILTSLHSQRPGSPLTPVQTAPQLLAQTAGNHLSEKTAGASGQNTPRNCYSPSESSRAWSAWSSFLQNIPKRSTWE